MPVREVSASEVDPLERDDDGLGDVVEGVRVGQRRGVASWLR